MRATIRLVRVSSTHAYPPEVLTPQISSRFGCARIPLGEGPTGIVATAVRLTRLIAVSVPSAVFATYAYKCRPGRRMDGRCSRTISTIEIASRITRTKTSRTFHLKLRPRGGGVAKRDDGVATGWLVERAMNDRRDLAHFFHQLLEFLRNDRLRAVGKRVVRIVMHLHDQAVSAHGNCGARKRKHF